MKAAPLNSNLASKFHRFSHFSVFFFYQGFLYRHWRFTRQQVFVTGIWDWEPVDLNSHRLLPLHYTFALHPCITCITVVTFPYNFHTIWGELSILFRLCVSQSNYSNYDDTVIGFLIQLHIITRYTLQNLRFVVFW